MWRSQLNSDIPFSSNLDAQLLSSIFFEFKRNEEITIKCTQIYLY